MNHDPRRWVRMLEASVTSRNDRTKKRSGRNKKSNRKMADA
jgi:hypothetical protein